MNIEICGAFAKRQEPNEFHMRLDYGMSEYLFVHFYNSVNIVLDGEAVQTRKNACIIFTPNFHQEYWTNEKPFINDYIKFFPKSVADIDRLRLPFNKIFYIDNEFSYNVERIIDSITWMLTDRIVNHSVGMSDKFFSLFNELKVKMINETPKEKRDKIQNQKLTELRNTVKNEPFNWTVDKMAKALYLTRSHFSYIYRNYFSCPPKDDILKFTMEYSKKILLETDMTISEISEKCGYTCPENFSRAFKLYYGSSPQSYRKLYKQNPMLS